MFGIHQISLYLQQWFYHTGLIGNSLSFITALAYIEAMTNGAKSNLTINVTTTL
jgi:hypothetical protein